ncbi:MAG: RNA chaperone Hfq [Ignavibacteria bacterium]|nr:RNA chaperone Hfq [Ignavibacteria bacterium]
MNKDKKKESLVEKPSGGSKTIISTLKKPQIEKQQGSSEANQSAVPVSKKNVAVSPAQDDTYNFKVSVPESTGKDKQRYWEWVKFRTQIKVKLINGEIYQGYLRWYDRFSVKLITATEEIVIMKHGILCIFDEPKAGLEKVCPEPVVSV